MRFCPECGKRLVLQHIDGRERGACLDCRVGDWGLHMVSVGLVIARGDGSVLLGRRAEAPALGEWALPGGYVEGDETLHDAAVREAREEAAVDVELGAVVGVRSLARRGRHNTYVVFAATYVGGDPTPDGKEFDALDWFSRGRLTAVEEGVTTVTLRLALAAMDRAASAGLAGVPYAHSSGAATDLYVAIAPPAPSTS